MILYLDTSALVKLFVEESHSDRVRQAVAGSRLIVTHAIAFVEACAAFSRVAHDRQDEALLASLRRSLEIQWEAWEILEVNEALIRRAADLAGHYRLRAYHSVHLAAVGSAFDVFRGQAPFHFTAFDSQLNAAAREAGIPMLDV